LKQLVETDRVLTMNCNSFFIVSAHGYSIWPPSKPAFV
jgi:hypothetical protein